MKKIMIVIVVLLLILINVGCINNKQSTLNNSNISDVSENNSIDIKSNNTIPINIIKVMLPIETLEESYINEWEDYMLKNFNLNINLIVVNNDSELEDKCEEINYNGLIYIDNFYKLTNYKASILKPISETNEILNIKATVPEYQLKFATDKNQQIWYLPTTASNKIKARTYDENYFSESNLTYPNTLEEFRAVAEEISSSNGLIKSKNKYIAELDFENIIPDFYDIFVAHGIFPDTSGHAITISYNHLSKQWENIVDNPNFKSALLYIKDLYDQELIIEYIDYSIKNGSNQENVQLNLARQVNPGFVSSYGNPILHIFDIEAYGYFLTGNNKEKLIQHTSYVDGFGVLKNTNNVEEILSNIILNGNLTEEFKLAMYYGLPNHDYEIKDNLIIVDKYSGGSIVNRIGFHIIYNRSERILVYKDQINIADEIVKKRYEDYELLEEAEMFYDKYLYSCGLEYLEGYNEKMKTISDKSNIFLLELMNEVIKGVSSYEEAVEAYTIKCKDIEFEKCLDALN